MHGVTLSACTPIPQLDANTNLEGSQHTIGSLSVALLCLRVGEKTWWS